MRRNSSKCGFEPGEKIQTGVLSYALLTEAITKADNKKHSF